MKKYILILSCLTASLQSITSLQSVTLTLDKYKPQIVQYSEKGKGVSAGVLAAGYGLCSLAAITKSIKDIGDCFVNADDNMRNKKQIAAKITTSPAVDIAAGCALGYCAIKLVDYCYNKLQNTKTTPALDPESEISDDDEDDTVWDSTVKGVFTGAIALASTYLLGKMLKNNCSAMCSKAKWQKKLGKIGFNSTIASAFGYTMCKSLPYSWKCLKSAYNKSH